MLSQASTYKRNKLSVIRGSRLWGFKAMLLSVYSSGRSFVSTVDSYSKMCANRAPVSITFHLLVTLMLKTESSPT